MAEKTQKATPHKLREALKRGEVAKSRELTGLASYLSTVILLWMAAEPFGKRLLAIVERAVLAPTENDPLLVLQQVLQEASWVVLPVLLIGTIAALIVGAVQAQGVFSFEPLAPKFERINPATGLKNLFSTRQLFELAKTLLKTALLTATLGWIIVFSLDFMLKLVYTPAKDLLRTGGAVLFLLMRWAAVIYAICAGLDYWIQHFEFMKQQRMTVDEVRRELRDEEGDPVIRSKRRAHARTIVYSNEPPPENKDQSGS
jgi:type III secretion protein U